jgi:hypothetical protein
LEGDWPEVTPRKMLIGITRGVKLRHVVSNKGLKVNIDKVRAILTLTPPRTVVHPQKVCLSRKTG